MKSAASGRCPTVSHVLERGRPRKSNAGRAERSGLPLFEHRRSGCALFEPQPRIGRGCRPIGLKVLAEDAIRRVDRDALGTRFGFDMARRADGEGLRLQDGVSHGDGPWQHELQGLRRPTGRGELREYVE